MTGSPDLREPQTISLISLADRFIEDHKRMPDRAFAFVLGAGASRSSGIKGAAQMVEDWVRLLYREATGHVDGDGKGWATATTLGIKAYDPKDPAASYSELYHRMYAHDPDRGFAYLEEQIQKSEPSFGYSVLAQIMDETRHKVVITTNFDNLVADALSIFGKTYPLVCGHESLAGFISPRVRRPLVVKVHRDLLLAPKSAPEDLGDLPQDFRKALTQLFGHYTPIVIGYGGNDGSLMGFLKSLPPRSVPGGVYWCYWKDGGAPPPEIRQFVASQNGCLVPISGFDETMLLLSEALGYEVPDQFLRDRAEERANRIGEQVLALKAKLAAEQRRTSRTPAESADPSDVIAPLSTQAPPPSSDSTPSGNEADALVDALKSTMRRTSGKLRWWQWEDRARAAATDDERDRIYQEALAALPDSAELLGNYALFVQTVRKDPDKAETYYLRALEADSEHANNLGNYAVFLKNIRKDPDKAEMYYVRALEADPGHANTLGNYASFLTNVRKDPDKAETYYLRALEADPGHANNLGNYASFLQTIRKDPDKAEMYYVRALEADPEHANTLGNYALFLKNIRKDPDKAEMYYLRALEADPEEKNTLGNYANFLLDVRKEPDKSETYYVRALEADPNHPNNLGNYANFLLVVRKHPDKAETYYVRALEADPEHPNNLGNYARLLLESGRFEEGLSMLDRACATPEAELPKPLAAELRMYAVCHRLPDAWRASLPGLKTLLVEDKVTTGDWDFSGVIASAKTRGHPAAEWLDPLAAVCAGTADASTLEGWEDWRKA